jgi:hypothetical protein
MNHFDDTHARNDNATGKGGVEGFANQTKVHNTNVIAKTKKWQRVLTYLLSGRSLNRFEAERVVNDHCLHSSISGLERHSGIVFDRRFETVACLNGTDEVRVKRYWLRLEPNNFRRTRAVLGLSTDAANDAGEARSE